MDELIGRTVAGYEIQCEVGAGETATVYKAYRAALQLHVALKVLAARLNEDPAAVARFYRRARATARLRHPNIVPVHQVGQDDDLHYVAMDYVEGLDLASKLKDEGPLTADAALAILAQLAAALDFSHAEGVIHGDLRPAHILLAADGQAMLTGFAAPDAEGAATGEGSVYASPEQRQGRPPDGRSDIYSLGVVLYEMLTGQLPAAGGESDAALQPPSQLNDSLPAALDPVILRALHEQPTRRYQTAAGLTRAFARALDVPYEEEVPAPRPERPRAVPARARLLAVAALVVVLAGFAAARVLGGRSTATKAPTASAVPTEVRTEPTATASPTATVTPTPSPTRTATPTATGMPEPSATPAPSATATPTAVPPSATPIPTATLAPAPALLEPGAGAGVGGDAITFRWTWGRPLQVGEHFDLRVWREGEPHLGVAWTEEPSYRLTGLSGGVFYWSVAVVRETGTGSGGTPTWEAVSPESDERSFSYSPPGSPSEPPTSPPPTKPAEPTPKP